MMTPQHRPLALIGVLLVGAAPATAQTQRHLPAFAPGEQGSSNVHLMSHIPLGRMFTVGDVEVEQELSRPYAYLGRMHGITHSSGFSVINLTIPAKASVLYTWQIENAELHRGWGGLRPIYLKIRDRYYLAQSFQRGCQLPSQRNRFGTVGGGLHHRGSDDTLQ